MTDYEESLACFCSFMGFIVGLIVGIYAEVFRKLIVGNRPVKYRLVIERIDDNKSFSPENLKFKRKKLKL